MVPAFLDESVSVGSRQPQEASAPAFSFGGKSEGSRALGEPNLPGYDTYDRQLKPGLFRCLPLSSPFSSSPSFSSPSLLSSLSLSLPSPALSGTSVVSSPHLPCLHTSCLCCFFSFHSFPLCAFLSHPDPGPSPFSPTPAYTSTGRVRNLRPHRAWRVLRPPCHLYSPRPSPQRGPFFLPHPGPHISFLIRPPPAAPPVLFAVSVSPYRPHYANTPHHGSLLLSEAR